MICMAVIVRCCRHGFSLERSTKLVVVCVPSCVVADQCCGFSSRPGVALACSTDSWCVVTFLRPPCTRCAAADNLWCVCCVSILQKK